eukprot:TRINITY_DN11918_c0_g2_i1.p2 TRINITY_DN11918_c0_g2~~TRINITY_DN11918_c0_g2_i1.p2  ORF type:complete len:165 (+),score=74.08 TRINITY_DN11918_c0_g2_i1:505-999(+)
MCGPKMSSRALQNVDSVVAVVGDLLESVVAKGASDNVSIYDGQKVPAISIEEYLARWVVHTGCDTEVLVIAVIYIDRLCTRTGMQITTTNVHRMLLASLVVATKWQQDRVHANTHYAAVGGVTNAELSRLEVNFLNSLEWETHVEASLLTKYVKQFRMHRLWEC